MKKHKIFRYGGWKFVVSRDREFRQGEYEAVFRNALREGRSCHLFTLFNKGSDTALVQIRLFDDGPTHFEVFAPSLIRLVEEEKTVIIGVFDRSDWPEVP